MRKIYKYELKITDEQEIDGYCWFNVIHAGEQDGKLFIWAEVDTETDARKVNFAVYGTGHEIKGDSTIYEKSVQMSSG